MAYASKKMNLDVFYNMFKTEYETSVRNIEMCKEKADHIYEDVRRQWEEPSTDIQTCLENYDKVLTDLSQMADKLRKFNIQLELDAIHKFNETPNERFTYPLPKCLEYDIGYESECVITYIKDAKNKLFYITETGENSNTEQIVSKMQRYFQDNPKEFERTPRNGEVFGLHLEGYMFRAVKENGKSDKFSNFKAYLLDVGEIVTINECMQMYVLPSDYQKLPAQAVLCKLEELNVNDISPSEYLGKSLYVRHRFRIVDKDRTMLFVNLHADTNPFRNKVMTDSDSNAKNEKPVPQLTNPFKRYLCLKTKIDRCQIDFSDIDSREQSISNVTIEKSVVINDASLFNDARSSNQGSDYQGTLNSNNALNGNTMNGFDYSRNNELTKTVNFNNGFDMNYMGRVLNETLQNRKAIDINHDYTPKAGGTNLTEEQRKILYEEPLNTSNAMKAVLGYDPKDDKRICNFYNPATNSCFKGAKCRMEHVEKIKEGWTRDQAATIVDIANQIVYPRVGEQITIIPTHIINVEHFFGQMIQLEVRYEQPTLKELIYRMNSPENVQLYRPIKSMPVLFELVIAKYTDGFWYRAKILNIIDDDTVKVFYVDYGNSRVVSINETRLWDRRFEYLPFQAIRCKIAGIAEKRNKSLEAAEQLRKMILNLAIKAQVLNNIDQLDLQLWDVYNNDVAEELISMKLVDKKETQIIRKNQILPA